MNTLRSAGGSSGAPEGELLVQLYDGAIGQTRLAQAQVRAQNEHAACMQACVVSIKQLMAVHAPRQVPVMDVMESVTLDVDHASGICDEHATGSAPEHGLKPQAS